MLEELFGKVKQCTENQFCWDWKEVLILTLKVSSYFRNFSLLSLYLVLSIPRDKKSESKLSKARFLVLSFSTGSQVAIKEERPLVDTTFVLDLIWNIRRFIVRPSGLSCCVHLVSCLLLWIALIDKSYHLFLPNWKAVRKSWKNRHRQRTFKTTAQNFWPLV